MDHTESVTQWIAQLKQDDSLAQHKLWKRYYEQIVRLARAKLGGTPRSAVDEEDAAAKALGSFFRGVEKGRFPSLNDRHDLWQVLLMLTERKSVDQRRHELAGRRDARKQVAGVDHVQSDMQGVVQFVNNDPTPEFAALVAEELELVLQMLGDDQLRQIATDKLEGYSNEEIGQRVGISLRSIERRLRLIRDIWSEQTHDG